MTWDEAKHPRGQVKNKGQFAKSRETPLENVNVGYRMWAFNRGMERQVPLFPRQQKKDFRAWSKNADPEQLHREAVGHAEYDRRSEEGASRWKLHRVSDERRIATEQALGSARDPLTGMHNATPADVMSRLAKAATWRREREATERANAKHERVVDAFNEAQRETSTIMRRINSDSSIVPTAEEMKIVEKAESALKTFVSTHEPIWRGQGRGVEAQWNHQMHTIFNQDEPMSATDLIERHGYDKDRALNVLRRNVVDYRNAVTVERNIARIRGRATPIREGEHEVSDLDTRQEHEENDKHLTEFRGHIASHYKDLHRKIVERKEEYRAKKEKSEESSDDEDSDRGRHQHLFEEGLNVPGLVRPDVVFNGSSYIITLRADRDFHDKQGKLVARKGDVVSDHIERDVKDGGSNIYNDYFRLRKEMQGHGIAQEVQAQAIKTYRENGVSKMTVYAFSNGRDMNGGLTWAKLGFEWESADERSHTLSRFKTHMIDKHSVSNDAAEEMIQKIKHPWELAHVEINGKKAGEEFLLVHQWHGSFDLDPNSDSSKYFAKYLEASRRKKMPKKSDAA